MRLAAEAANIGLWAWDINRDTIWATDRDQALYGIPPDYRLMVFQSARHTYETGSRTARVPIPVRRGK